MKQENDNVPSSFKSFLFFLFSFIFEGFLDFWTRLNIGGKEKGKKERDRESHSAVLTSSYN